MDCRHTGPDWHRYVRPTGEALPIFAACRLLVKEGEPARDPRSVACAYWGRQPECPLYDGPGVQRRDPPRPGAWAAPQEVPVDPEAVWPVRAPGTTDRMRLVMIRLAGEHRSRGVERTGRARRQRAPGAGRGQRVDRDPRSGHAQDVGPAVTDD